MCSNVCNFWFRQYFSKQFLPTSRKTTGAFFVTISKWVGILAVVFRVFQQSLSKLNVFKNPIFFRELHKILNHGKQCGFNRLMYGEFIRHKSHYLVNCLPFYFLRFSIRKSNIDFLRKPANTKWKAIAEDCSRGLQKSPRPFWMYFWVSGVVGTQLEFSGQRRVQTLDSIQN